MNHFSWDQIANFLMALTAAISAFLAAWNSHKAVKTAEAVQAVQLGQVMRAQQASADVPASSIGINDVFRYWDLTQKVAAAIMTVKALPPHVAGSLGILKTKIGGRHAKVGPIPIEFED